MFSFEYLLSVSELLAKKRRLVYLVFFGTAKVMFVFVFLDSFDYFINIKSPSEAMQRELNS